MLEKLIIDGETTAGEEQHMSLRHELMMVCHAVQLSHASRADKMKALRALAYWPSAETDVEKFCDTCESSCDVCLANRNPMTRLGSSMTSTRRFGVMMIEKIGFDDDIAVIVGMPAALQMACPRIGDQQIRLCHSMNAVEAARV